MSILSDWMLPNGPAPEYTRERALLDALEQISGEAPVNAPPSAPPKSVFGSDTADIDREIFNDGVTYGLWLAAKIAREALSRAA